MRTNRSDMFNATTANMPETANAALNITISKLAVLVLFFLLIIPVCAIDSYSDDRTDRTTASSVDNWVYNSRFIELGFEEKGSIHIESSASGITDLNIDLKLVPETTKTQEVLSIESVPAVANMAARASRTAMAVEPGNVSAGSGSFLWHDIEPGSTIDFSVTAQVRVENRAVLIKNKVEFPIKRASISSEALPYTTASSNVISNDIQVMRKAYELSQGETDLYKVVFKTADWVETNIDYSLGTLTEKAVQNSTWVYEHREGVCDELTTLFIAMLRSLGIPARYVSGIAYTNFNNINDFGPHAWAEVYFPGYGWLPFDVAYKEYGFVDATHIKLKESIDPEEPSVEYSWKSYGNAAITPSELSLKAKVLGQSGIIGAPVSVSAEPLRISVGPGSYNAVLVSIENLQDYYVPVHIQISNTQGLEVVDTNSIKTAAGNTVSNAVSNAVNYKNMLLAPRERRKTFWIMKLDSEMLPNYLYTFPLSVYARQSSATTYFQAESTGNVLSKEEVIERVKQRGYYDLANIAGITSTARHTEASVQAVQALDINCTNSYAYQGQAVEISCILTNIGSTYLDFVLCLGNCGSSESLEPSDYSEKGLLGINNAMNISFIKSFQNIGDNKVVVIARDANSKDTNRDSRDRSIAQASNRIIAAYYHHVFVMGEPNIIVQPECPASIAYNDTGQVKFSLKKSSASTPVNLKVKLYKNNQFEEYTAEDLASEHTFSINASGKTLLPKNNVFKAIVSYEDLLARKYYSEAWCTVQPKTRGLQKLLLYINSIGDWVVGLFE